MPVNKNKKKFCEWNAWENSISMEQNEYNKVIIYKQFVLDLIQNRFVSDEYEQKATQFLKKSQFLVCVHCKQLKFFVLKK